VWTRERILQAIDAHARHLGRPPKSREWGRGTAEHPSVVTVRNRFGSWNEALRAAGLPIREPVAARPQLTR
jgi:hypothetical protein